jgi:uncharacterized membrane protein
VKKFRANELSKLRMQERQKYEADVKTIRREVSKIVTVGCLLIIVIIFIVIIINVTIFLLRRRNVFISFIVR